MAEQDDMGYPEPFDRDRWMFLQEEEGLPVKDYTVAINKATGAVVRVWEGTQKRAVFNPDEFVQVTVKRKTPQAARHLAGALYRTNQIEGV